MEHWEFYVGLAVQTLLFLGGGYGMVLRNDWSAQNMKEQMKGMQDELKKLAEVIVQQAVQTTRIDAISTQLATVQKEVSDLRRGDGFIRGRHGIDKEYGD
jgi:hypothetical protein